MKRRIFILLAFFSLTLQAAEGGRFSVLTCSPGDEAYSLFGHTALRYFNEASGIDKVYNYGYFSFDAPNFVWRFVLGRTDYLVAAVPFPFFIEEYVERGSRVTEQVLNLSPEQVDELYGLLQENCRPQNRVYRYNYFYANCTTKARDKFMESLGEGCCVAYATPSVQLPTFREALHEKTALHSWYSFGIDLLLGSDADEICTAEEMQFIPENFMNSLAAASVVTDAGNVPAVAFTKILTEEKVSAPVRNNFTPFNAALLLLVFTFIVQLCELRSRKTYWGYDILLMTFQGLSGCLLMFMAIFSEHPAVDENYTILLLNPLALFIMPIMVHRIIKHKPLGIAWVQVTFVALFFVAVILRLQSFPTPLYFCAAAIAVRSLFHIYKKKICELNIV